MSKYIKGDKVCFRVNNERLLIGTIIVKEVTTVYKIDCGKVMVVIKEDGIKCKVIDMVEEIKETV